MAARHEHIDIARGLGIVLVVLGHNSVINEDPGWVHRVIYSFHMPLFFFLSGLFLLCLVGLVLLAASHVVEPNVLNLNSRRYGEPFSATLGVVGGISAVLGASVLAVRWRSLARGLAYAGAGSLFILLFHGVSQDIAVTFVRSELPRWPGVALVVGVLAGCAIPLLIGSAIRMTPWLRTLFLRSSRAVRPLQASQ